MEGGGGRGEKKGGGLDFPLELTGLSLSSLKFFSVFHLSGPCQGELSVLCVHMRGVCV